MSNLLVKHSFPAPPAKSCCRDNSRCAATSTNILVNEVTITPHETGCDGFGELDGSFFVPASAVAEEYLAMN